MLAPGMAEPASQLHGGGKCLPERMQAACAKEPAKFLEEGRGKQQQSGRAGPGNLAAMFPFWHPASRQLAKQAQ